MIHDTGFFVALVIGCMVGFGGATPVVGEDTKVSFTGGMGNLAWLWALIIAKIIYKCFMI